MCKETLQTENRQCIHLAVRFLLQATPFIQIILQYSADLYHQTSPSVAEPTELVRTCQPPYGQFSRADYMQYAWRARDSP